MVIARADSICVHRGGQAVADTLHMVQPFKPGMLLCLLQTPLQ